MFGDERPFIGCAVVLDRAHWARLAVELGLDADTATVLDTANARDAVLARIAVQTRAFPAYARPRAVTLSFEPWSVENGLMTPTLKLKRLNLAAHFALPIEAMYRRPAPVR